jgi:hypothetical protein
MKYLVRISAPTLILLLFLQVLPASGQEKQREKPWTGKLEDGTVITKQYLAKILAEHKKWIETEGHEELRANLGGAILTNADLEGANLTDANLGGTTLTNADLS